MRTDQVEGFLLDRSFQVLQTAYPEARRVLDYRALDLKPFYPGALVHSDGRLYRVGDPLRQPQHLFPTVLSPIGTFADKLRVARLSPWLFVCREYPSLSSIHRAMVSGRRAGEAVVRELHK